MYSSGAKFKKHCFNISRDTLYWVLYCFSETTYDVITFLTKMSISPKLKKIFCKQKRHSSMLWKAFQISINQFLLHRHFNHLDNFMGVAPQTQGWRAYHFIGGLLSQLGLRELTTKPVSPSTVVICLRVKFYTVEITMSLAPFRLVEIISLLESWHLRKSCTESTYKSLTGKLMFVLVRANFLFYVIWTCSAWFHFLRNMCTWLLNFVKIFTGGKFFYRITMAYSSSPLPNRQLQMQFLPQMNIWVDAVAYSPEYFHSVFPSFIPMTCSRIHHLELLVVMVAVRLWGHHWQSHRIQLLCDNAQCSILVVLRILYKPPSCAKSGCNQLRESLNCKPYISPSLKTTIPGSSLDHELAHFRSPLPFSTPWMVPYKAYAHPLMLTCNCFSGVKLLHLLGGQDISLFRSFELTILLRGLDRLAKHIPRRAIPITPDILLKLVSLADLRNPVDVTFMSPFLFTFFLASPSIDLAYQDHSVQKMASFVTLTVYASFPPLSGANVWASVFPWSHHSKVPCLLTAF